jgi:hypothetical protein
LCQHAPNPAVDADSAHAPGRLGAEFVVTLKFISFQFIVGLKAWFEFQREFQPELRFGGHPVG